MKLAQNMPAGMDLPGFLVSPVKLTPQPRPTARGRERRAAYDYEVGRRGWRAATQSTAHHSGLSQHTRERCKDDAKENEEILKATSVHFFVGRLVLVEVAFEASVAGTGKEVGNGGVGV